MPVGVVCAIALALHTSQLSGHLVLSCAARPAVWGQRGGSLPRVHVGGV